MNRDEKNKKRLEQSNKRRARKVAVSKAKLEHKKQFGSNSEMSYFYKGFQCEMGYGDCERRGYCNGDC